jgi:hypothetical protein
MLVFQLLNYLFSMIKKLIFTNYFESETIISAPGPIKVSDPDQQH